MVHACPIYSQICLPAHWKDYDSPLVHLTNATPSHSHKQIIFSNNGCWETLQCFYCSPPALPTAKSWTPFMTPSMIANLRHSFRQLTVLNHFRKCMLPFLWSNYKTSLGIEFFFYTRITSYTASTHSYQSPQTQSRHIPTKLSVFFHVTEEVSVQNHLSVF